MLTHVNKINVESIKNDDWKEDFISSSQEIGLKKRYGRNLKGK